MVSERACGLQRDTMTSKGAPLPLDLGPHLVLKGPMASISKGAPVGLDLGPRLLQRAHRLLT